MDKGLIIGVVVLLAVLLALPLISHVVNEQKGEDTQNTSESSPAQASGQSDAAAPAYNTPKEQPRNTAQNRTGSGNNQQPFPSPQQIDKLQLPENVQEVAPGQFRVKERANAAAPKLNAQNLVGSVWAMQGGTIELLPGGMARAKHPQMNQLELPPEIKANGLPASWSVNGKWIRLSAMGYSLDAQIVGHQIMGPNGPVRCVRKGRW